MQYATATYAEPLDEAALVVVTSLRRTRLTLFAEERIVYGNHRTPLADDLVRKGYAWQRNDRLARLSV